MINENLTRKDLEWILPGIFLLGMLFCGEVWPEYKDIFHKIVWVIVAAYVTYSIWVIVQLTKKSDHINTPSDDEVNVALKDGREYKIELDSESVFLLHRKSGEYATVKWEELTEVYILAIDNFPIGRMSFMLHKENDVLEIPTDAEGNEALLKEMQNSLSGFNNQALIDSIGMLHGFKKLWCKNS